MIGPAPVTTNPPQQNADPTSVITAFLIVGGGVVAILIIVMIAMIIKKIIKRHKAYWKEWNYSAKYLKSDNNGSGYLKYICLPFKTFHDYFSLNPSRYDLREAMVYVTPQDPNYPHDYEYIIIFTRREYKKYKEWVVASTNGMNDPKSVQHSLKYLEIVQKDIQAIRDKEAKAVSESQKTIQEVMENLIQHDLSDFQLHLGKEDKETKEAKWPEWVEE